MKLHGLSKIGIAALLTFAMVTQTFALTPAIENSTLRQDTVAYAGETYIQCKEFGDETSKIFASGDQYVMEIVTPEENVLVPVNRVDVPFIDETAVSTFLDKDNIPEEAKESFIEKYRAYTEDPESYDVSPSLTFFEPDVATRASSGDPDYIFYHTENGYPMMTYLFEYIALSSKWKDVERGSATKATTAAIKEAVIQAASYVDVTIAFMISGISIFDAFLSNYGLSSVNVTTDVDDYFQARIVYDQDEKYTMTDFGGLTSWQTGLVTYRIEVKQLGQETYFANTGKGPFTTDVYYDDDEIVVQSEHHSSPWATALANGGYTEWEYVTWKVGDELTYRFT